ncbi:MAG TPA: preprotein translocase subunit YajC [Nocardioidaceae bacterium]|nr:preprotein translocase subunit YajC [Nocardioidaceae bacterium]
MASLLPFVLIAAVFYLLILRPQRRRQQALVATQSSLRPGAEVMLSSGIFGRVASLDDETIRLEVSPGALVKVSRQAVVRVIDQQEQPHALDEDDTPGSPDQHP